MSRLSIAVNAKDHMQGDSDALLTLVEYGDYECPYCGGAYPIVKRLQERLGDKLLFVFRNFPLREMHPHAEHAAETAEVCGLLAIPAVALSDIVDRRKFLIFGELSIMAASVVFACSSVGI